MQNMENASIGATVAFGGYNWKVLDREKGSVLLLSELVLSPGIRYNSRYEDATWETCTLRKYLNDDCYHSFSAEERALILEATIKTEPNPWRGTPGGSDTLDHIFLLSAEEVAAYLGGPFENLYEGKSEAIEGRIANNASGAPAWWWTRSPGAANSEVIVVNTDGSFSESENFFARYTGGMRPAMWVKL